MDILVNNEQVLIELENKDFHRFNERVRLLSYARSLGYPDLTKACKVPPNTFYRYNTGIKHPDVKTLAKLSVFFGVSMNWLIGIEDYAVKEEELVELFRRAYKEDKEAIMAILSKYDVQKETKA